MLDLKDNIEDEKVDDSIETMIAFKTASLFSLAFILGGIYSCTPVDIENFRSMGSHLGIMFQIMDDFGDVDEGREIQKLRPLLME